METPLHPSWATRVFARTRIFRRPIYIFWLSLLAIVFFAFTFGINRLYARRLHELSRYWSQRGQKALSEGNANEAITDLRTALLYSHDNPQYLFTLARALEAADRATEARSYFLNLLEDEPGRGDINLELAHIAAKQNDVNHALRYLNGAIYGAWNGDPILERQRVRQELIVFLIAKGFSTQARGELLTYTTEMPKTPESRLWVASAFSQLGDQSGALDFYRAALRANRQDAAALSGAGDAAFNLGRYREALDYYKRADAVHKDPRISQKMQLVSLLLELDPFASRISAAERRHRLLLALDIADQRLRRCADAQHASLEDQGPSPLQQARSQWLQLDQQIRAAKNGSDLVQLSAELASLVMSIEQQNGCGPPTDADQAVLRVYRSPEELTP